MLPSGWGFEDSRAEGERPWRATTRPGGRWELDGVTIEVHAESRDKVIEAIRLIDAGAAAIPHGWGFNHNHGFVP